MINQDCIICRLQIFLRKRPHLLVKNWTTNCLIHKIEWWQQRLNVKIIHVCEKLTNWFFVARLVKKKKLDVPGSDKSWDHISIEIINSFKVKRWRRPLHIFNNVEGWMQNKRTELFHIWWELGQTIIALAVRAKLQCVDRRIFWSNNSEVVRHNNCSQDREENSVCTNKSWFKRWTCWVA